MKEERWQREHGGGGPAKSESQIQQMRQQGNDERMRRNEENFRNRSADPREEQIRRLQEKQSGDGQPTASGNIGGRGRIGAGGFGGGEASEASRGRRTYLN